MSLHGLNGTVHVNKYLLNEKNISGGIKEVMLSSFWFTAGSVHRDSGSRRFCSFGKGWVDGWDAGPRGGERRRNTGAGTHSEKQASAGRRLVGSWGPDTHCMELRMGARACVHMCGRGCVCKTNNLKMNLIIRHF